MKNIKAFKSSRFLAGCIVLLALITAGSCSKSDNNNMTPSGQPGANEI
jgi:hypothetical protein